MNWDTLQSLVLFFGPVNLHEWHFFPVKYLFNYPVNALQGGLKRKAEMGKDVSQSLVVSLCHAVAMQCLQCWDVCNHALFEDIREVVDSIGRCADTMCQYFPNQLTHSTLWSHSQACEPAMCRREQRSKPQTKFKILCAYNCHQRC